MNWYDNIGVDGGYSAEVPSGDVSALPAFTHQSIERLRAMVANGSRSSYSIRYSLIGTGLGAIAGFAFKKNVFGVMAIGAATGFGLGQLVYWYESTYGKLNPITENEKINQLPKI